jgi:hypothetical protein
MVPRCDSESTREISRVSQIPENQSERENQTKRRDAKTCASVGSFESCVGEHNVHLSEVALPEEPIFLYLVIVAASIEPRGVHLQQQKRCGEEGF